MRGGNSHRGNFISAPKLLSSGERQASEFFVSIFQLQQESNTDVSAHTDSQV
jgi:hypothetical protein